MARRLESALLGREVCPSGTLLYGIAAKECADGRKRVLPGDPSSSYLMQKLLNVSMCSGSQMPKAGASIPNASLQAISDWICSGAPNN